MSATTKLLLLLVWWSSALLSCSRAAPQGVSEQDADPSAPADGDTTDQERPQAGPDNVTPEGDDDVDETDGPDGEAGVGDDSGAGVSSEESERSPDSPAFESDAQGEPSAEAAVEVAPDPDSEDDDSSNNDNNSGPGGEPKPDGPLSATQPTKGTVWNVGDDVEIEFRIGRGEYKDLKVEFCTGSDTDQVSLRTVYEGDFPEGDDDAQIEWVQYDPKIKSYPYGELYFFRFTVKDSKGKETTVWTTRYSVVNPSDPNWPNFGAWNGVFEGKVDEDGVTEVQREKQERAEKRKSFEESLRKDSEVGKVTPDRNSGQTCGSSWWALAVTVVSGVGLVSFW